MDALSLPIRSITQAQTGNGLNMGLNKISMRLFTLSLMELLIGIPARGRWAPWGRHQSHMTRTAVICVCGKTPSTKHCLYYQQISLLERSSGAARKKVERRLNLVSFGVEALSGYFIFLYVLVSQWCNGLIFKSD